MEADEEEVTYLIEEVIYVNEKKMNSGKASLSSSSFDENQSDEVKSGPSHNLQERSTVSPEKESILIKKLISGELSFSEYNKEMDKNTNISDDEIEEDEGDDDDEEEDDIEYVIPHEEKSKTKASKHFEAELHKTRKDAMRGNLKGRFKMKDGRQRRRCVLPAALQGLMGEANLRYIFHIIRSTYRIFSLYFNLSST